jgi:hypothetical protein
MGVACVVCFVLCFLRLIVKVSMTSIPEIPENGIPEILPITLDPPQHKKTTSLARGLERL